MAGVSAGARLRSGARDAIFAAGGRGFVRFAPAGGALFLSDACRRSDAARLVQALNAAGFDCRIREDLMEITPRDALLPGLAKECPGFAVDWKETLCGAQALAARWMAREKAALTPAGRQLILETLRLTWKPFNEQEVQPLRARAAAMLREGDTGGLREAGLLLAQACRLQEKG